MRCYKCGSYTCSNDCDLTDVALEGMEPPAEYDEIQYAWGYLWDSDER